MYELQKKLAFFYKHTYILDTVQEFYYQVGHQATYASMGNKHFFTK